MVFLAAQSNLNCRGFLSKDIAITDLLEHKPILTAGYNCVLHIHTVSVEVEIDKLLYEVRARGTLRHNCAARLPLPERTRDSCAMF